MRGGDLLLMASCHLINSTLALDGSMRILSVISAIKATLRSTALNCARTTTPTTVDRMGADQRHPLKKTGVLHCRERGNSDAASCGVPEYTASGHEADGHKTPSVFQRHNIVSDGDMRAAAARRLDAQIRQHSTSR